ncbi:MAG TPA: hypothetical protein VL134_08510 [Leptolyngbya sp.]|jgi:hypothetical protein|nr:hypothetical protein [Leptolyngbya sp.]
MADSNSQRTSPTKTNTNQNGLIDPKPGEIPTEADYSRDDQAINSTKEAALERPTEEPTEEKQKQS